MAAMRPDDAAAVIPWTLIIRVSVQIPALRTGMVTHVFIDRSPHRNNQLELCSRFYPIPHNGGIWCSNSIDLKRHSQLVICQAGSELRAPAWWLPPPPVDAITVVQLACLSAAAPQPTHTPGGCV